MLALRGTCHTESCPCYAVFIVTNLLKDLIKLKNCKPNCLGPVGVGGGGLVLKKFLGGDVPLGAWNPLPIPGGGGGGVLPIMAYTGRLRPKGVPFSGFRYKKG